MGQTLNPESVGFQNPSVTTVAPPIGPAVLIGHPAPDLADRAELDLAAVA